MSKRRRSPRATAPAEPGPCPCGLPAPYRECCGPLHRGAAPAATAERLMRSRYTAFVLGDTGHLLRTWHPSTRPAALRPDPAVRWQRLEVAAVTDGGPFHAEGTVEFRAHYREGGRAGELHEVSRFTRDGGAWVYLGAVPGPGAGGGRRPSTAAFRS